MVSFIALLHTLPLPSLQARVSRIKRHTWPVLSCEHGPQSGNLYPSGLKMFSGRKKPDEFPPWWLKGPLLLPTREEWGAVFFLSPPLPESGHARKTGERRAREDWYRGQGNRANFTSWRWKRKGRIVSALLSYPIGGFSKNRLVNMVRMSSFGFMMKSSEWFTL